MVRKPILTKVGEFCTEILFTDVGDTILDPFFGSGTTGAVAKKLGRKLSRDRAGQDYIGDCADAA